KGFFILDELHVLKVINILLDCCQLLSEVEFYYKTYGTYSPYPNNAVLVFHALTGNNDPADWWNGIIGERKIIDPKKHFIICANFLGSCYGSTGPESIDPKKGKPYHEHFPDISTGDIARQHLAILDSLGIEKV